MAQGSNELNMLLKAKVVKLKVELDYKGSKLPSQVNAISKFLENKPVKLKVQLSASVTDLNKQLKTITNTLNNSKSFKPIKVGVEIDVKGSATKIKNQLKEIQTVMDDFNKKYSKQMRETQDKINKSTPKQTVGNVPTNASVGNYNNIKQYVRQLKEAETIMKSKLGAKQQGLFSSFEIKDAKGNLQGFIATLEKSNGVIEKVRYSFDKSKNSFVVVDRSTATATEKMLHRQMQSLQDLQRELDKTGKHSKELQKEQDALMKAGVDGSLTADMVKAHQTKIKNIQATMDKTKQENDILREQKKLIHDISRSMGKTKGSSKEDLAGLKSQLTGMSSDTLKDPSTKTQLADIKRQFDVIKQGYSDQMTKEKQLQSALEKKKDIINTINNLMKSTNAKTGFLGKTNLQEVKDMAQSIDSMERYMQVKKRMNEIDRAKKTDDTNKKVIAEYGRLEKAMTNYGIATGKSASVIEKRFEMLKRNIGTNLAQAHAETQKWTKKLESFKTNDLLTRRANSIVDTNHKDVKSAVDERDVSRLKEYIGGLEKANIATLKLSTNSKGVSTITAQLESTGKTAKQVSYQIDNLDGKLRHMGSADVFNRNANLGIFEQLGIAMKRVPVWMVAMTAFHGSIRAVSNMTSELLKIDKAVTNIKRVASDNINVDSLLGSAVGLSAELGNNIHDILGAVEELARTFGDFNERQLTAVAKTAVLMSNVSDLTVEEATNTLVGTMNAFNIEASESIRIVDALNEVDNDYAISTKQLAQGLAKSASTAKTFGVSMEQTAGHITSIGSVTMESGAIIGNSLKTIYSRITTLNTSEDILKGVGVEMYKMGDAGQKAVRPVNDILSDLASNWHTLSDEQRQNTAVSLAGRYQLSRFLAMMNNWETATKATRTALSSQGSAMRENAEYMNSFEARLNKLKNAFTELSMSIGDRVLNGAIFTVIEGLSSLARVAINVVDSFGALPVIMAVLGVIAFKMKLFNGTLLSLRGGLAHVATGFTQASVGSTMFARTLTGVKGAIVSTTAITGVFARSLVTLKATMMGLMASTGIGLIFVGIGVAIEKLIGIFEKQKRTQEKIEKANKQLIDSYRNTEGGLQGLIDKQKELQRAVDTGAIKEGTDAYNEYVEITNRLAEKMPTAIKYIDQSGLAHLREADAIKQQYEIAKKLSELKAKETVSNYESSLDKNLEKIEKELKISKELLEAEQKLLKAEETRIKNGTNKKRDTGTARDNMRGGNDITKDLQKNNMEYIQSQQAVAGYIQKTMELVQNTTLSYMESEGQLKNLTDTGKTIIEQTVQQNENLLRYSKKNGELVENNVETIEKRADALYDTGKTLGKLVSDTYESLSKGVDDPLQLEEINTNMDNVVKSLPDTFFKMDNIGDGDKIASKFKDILTVSKEVQNGSADWDALTSKVQSFGFTADEASAFISRMGIQYDNAEIKSRALTEAQNEGQESLEAWVDTAIQAIDVSESLFGYNDGDLGAIQSHIEAMETMLALRGDIAKETDAYKASLEEVSLFLGVDEAIIDKDLAYYRNMADLMGKVALEYDETTGAIKGFNKEGLNKTQIKMLNEMIALSKNHQVEQDVLTKKYYDIKTGLEQVVDEQGNFVDKVSLSKDELNALGQEADNARGKVSETATSFENMFRIINDEGGKSHVFTDLDGELYHLNGSVGDLKLAFSNLQENINTPTGNAVLDGLIGKLSITDGTINNTKENIEILKQILDNPTNVNLLNNEQLESTETKVAKVKDAVVRTREEIQKNKQESLFNESDNSANVAKAQIDGVDSSSKNAKGSIDGLNNSVNKLVNVNVPKGKFKDIYRDMEASSQTSKDKVDILVQSIQKASDSASILTALDGKVNDSILKANGLKSALVSALTGFDFSALNQSLINMSTNANNASSSVSKAVNAMKFAYSKASESMKTSISGMSAFTKVNIDKIVGIFVSSSPRIRKESSTMANGMRKAFKTGLDSMAKDANSLPARIASAIRNNMSSSSSAMTALANSMANKFTSTLMAGINRGISSASRRSGGGGSGGVGGFQSTSGEGSTSVGGGDSGASGTMITSNTSILSGGMNLEGGYDFHSLAGSKENIADAVVFSLTDRKASAYANSIAVLEAQMARMTKTTTKYRDAVKQLISYENSLLVVNKNSLSATISRQGVIERALKNLPALSKQTTAQRETYNKLQTEYNENISKIESLRVTIENSITSIKEKSLEIFNDFIGQIVGEYDVAINKIKDKVDNIDFKIDVITLTNPDDKKGLLNAQIDKANELSSQQATSKNKVDSLQSQYNTVVKSKGENSDEAKAVKEQLDKALEDYEDYTIAVLQAEKDIKDTRAEIADEGIKALKDYYSNLKEMATKAIDLEQKALENAHKDKMDMYDKEIDKINSVYNEKLKQLDKEKSEESYNEDLKAKNTEKSNLVNKISLLSKDNSKEGQRKLAEAQAELDRVNKEIKDLQEARAEEVLREELAEQKDKQIRDIESEKETEQGILDEKLKALEEQKEAVNKHYEDILNNEKYWSDMRNEFVKGNFTLLNSELANMKIGIDNMNKGIYDGLFAGFSGLSEEVKKQVAEINKLVADNMQFETKDKVQKAKDAEDAKPYVPTNGVADPSKGEKVETPKQTTPPAPAPAPPKKEEPKKEEPKNKDEYYTIQKGDTFSGLEARFKLPKGSLQKLNPNLDPRKLQIGQKILLRKGGSSSSSSANTGSSASSAENRKTTSALNFRSTPAYGKNVMMTIPKDAKVHYVGMEKGWAKIKYKGKTGFVGADYLKKFDTGGYTGDWSGSEGKVAMLHKKELVLNEKQTKDILDTSKIIQKVASVIPVLQRNVLSKDMSKGTINIKNDYNLTVNIENLNGDKKGADLVVKKIIDGLKKMGK